jgi:D-amino-acid dehydrogenase
MAELIVIGAGVMGAPAAYRLAQAGADVTTHAGHSSLPSSAPLAVLGFGDWVAFASVRHPIQSKGLWPRRPARASVGQRCWASPAR